MSEKLRNLDPVAPLLDTIIYGVDISGETPVDGKITVEDLADLFVDEKFGGLVYPATDGTAGQVIKTDGAGNLSFEDMSGGISSTITTTYTITSSDYIIVGEHATVAFTMTLPAVGSTAIGKEYVIKNLGAAEVTVAGNGAELIDSTNTKILNQYDSMTIINSGSKWLII